MKINTNTEVLNKDNQPIKGLYVAGELVGAYMVITESAVTQ